MALSWATADWEWVSSIDFQVVFYASVAATWGVVIAISAGLYFFNRVARILYVVSVPIFVSVSVWFGLGGTETNREALFDYLTSLCTGAVLALMWLSPPIRQAFGGKQPNLTNAGPLP